jgi:putative endonuclease
VFVEVKSWQTGRTGQSPAEAVTDEKEKSVALAASEFLQEHNLTEQPCRFDVVAIILGEVPPQIEHFAAAFEPPIDW